MPYQILGSDEIIRLNNYPLLGMVQNFDAQAALNPEEIFELGRTTKVDTSFELTTTGSFELISIGNTAGLFARMAPRFSAGAFVGYAYSGNANKNAYCFTEADLVNCQFDVALYMRPDQTTFTRSIWYPRCFLTSIAGRADAAGNASETYSWAGTFFSGFDTPYHDIIASPCTVASSSTLDVEDTVVAAATYTLAYVYVDERLFRNQTTADASKFTLSGIAGSAVLTLTTTEGYTIPANAICRAVFYKTAAPSSTFPSVASGDRGTSAFYVKGYQVNIYVAPADSEDPQASEKWLKVQSADYNIDLRSEELKQLSQNTQGTATYARVPTLPFNITLNASAYSYDWTHWRAMMTKTPGTDVYTDSYDLAPATLKGDPSNPLAVVLEYFTKGGTLLQRLEFTDMTVETWGDRVAVQGRAETTIAMRGTAFRLCGVNA